MTQPRVQIFSRTLVANHVGAAGIIGRLRARIGHRKAPHGHDLLRQVAFFQLRQIQQRMRLAAFAQDVFQCIDTVEIKLQRATRRCFGVQIRVVRTAFHGHMDHGALDAGEGRGNVVNRLGIDRLCHVGRGAFGRNQKKADIHEFCFRLNRRKTIWKRRLTNDVSDNNLNSECCKKL